MKKAYLSLVVAIAMVALAPLAKADQIDFSATSGTVVVTNGGFSISNATANGGTPSTLSGIVDNANGTSYAGSLGTLSFTSGDSYTSGTNGAGLHYVAVLPGGNITIATNSSFLPDMNDASAFVGSFITNQLFQCLDSSCSTAQFSGNGGGTFSSAFASAMDLGNGGSGLFISGLLTQVNGGWTVTSIDFSVPEPATAGLLGLGFLALAVGVMFRKRSAEMA